MKLFKISFSYTEAGSAVISAESEEALVEGFYELFGTELDDLEITGVEVLEENFDPSTMAHLTNSTETIN